MSTIAHSHHPSNGHGSHAHDPAHGHDSHGHHHKETFITKYIFSQDHKMIAKQYLLSGMLMALIAAGLSLLFRLQLGWPDRTFPWLESIIGEWGKGGRLDPNFYLALVTLHGTLMSFPERQFRDEQEKQSGPQPGGPSALSPGDRGYSPNWAFLRGLSCGAFPIWALSLSTSAKQGRSQHLELSRATDHPSRNLN
ncbi:MAG: hypothetical protein ACKO81_10570 [Planctomycetota bacterium]